MSLNKIIQNLKKNHFNRKKTEFTQEQKKQTPSLNKIKKLSELKTAKSEAETQHRKDVETI